LNYHKNTVYYVEKNISRRSWTC